MDSIDAPISTEEFAQYMAGVGLEPGDGPVAIAVSGGADSLALTLLAAQWGEAVGLTVEHGLRPESPGEAEQVHQWLARREIPHHVLTWEGPKPSTGLQAAARQARYRLLENWCRSTGIDTLLLAHHRDDQAETFLLRLARGSGLRGLAAMAPQTGPLSAPDTGVPQRYRPLLDVPKSRLIATCRDFRQSWLEDPSNSDPAHMRTQVRRLLADPPITGLTASRLAETAARLRRARSAIDHYVAVFLDAHARLDPAGFAEVDRNALLDIPVESALRALERLLSSVGGLAAPPRGERIERAYLRISAAEFSGLTTLGCQLFTRDDERSLVICREPAAISDAKRVGLGETVVWDGRFRIENQSAQAVSVEALGKANWRQLKERLPADQAAEIPVPAGACLPAIRNDERDLVVPPLNIVDEALPVSVRFLPLASP